MTDIVPTPAPPTVPPYPALGSSNFNSEAYTYGSNMPGVVAGIQAMCQAAWTNAVAGQERATAAAASANTAGTQAINAAAARAGAEAARDTAITQAGNASASATAASASALQVDKRYLGAKAAAPTTDNQGAALQGGAIYYDTTAKQVKTWTGDSWVAGISSVAGVSSLNGQAGALVKTTLASYGITNFRVDEGLPENVNLASVVTSGIYRYNTAADNPPGILYSPLLVCRSVDTCSQIVVAYGSGSMFIRGGVVLNGVLVDAATRSGPPAWRRVAYQTDRAVSTTGEMDLSLGTRFMLAVNGGTVALSFANVPAAEAVSVLLEVHYVSGGFSLPAGSIWANGRVPEIVAGKRHLIYFERCIAGSTAGWYVSALTGFAA
ncbi:pyocin knob domain-containing protein [Paracidovorax citrulli]|uniref:pyocin knob domain-containing protein n=1 Tax=Paracidovorax citrulli TaxID=80869 RepID=UPI0006969101|nr:pyocin knob domain-containing protein [Paracidovorax citrulli]